MQQGFEKKKHILGYSRKKRKHVEITGIFYRCVREKIMNFHGSWVLTLKLPRRGVKNFVTKFCRISKGENFFSLKFLRSK